MKTISFFLPFGYARYLPLEDAGISILESHLQNKKMWIVDIRKMPYGPKRFPMWHGSNLKKKYRYIHMGELGNINYKNRENGIQFVDEEAGMKRLKTAFEKGYSVLLLCGCKHYHTCHRSKVIHQFLKYLQGK